MSRAFLCFSVGTMHKNGISSNQSLVAAPNPWLLIRLSSRFLTSKLRKAGFTPSSIYQSYGIYL